MHWKRHFVLSAALLLPFASAHRVQAADELAGVLHRLDVASTNFRTTTADFEFDTYQTDPVPDKDIQKGTVYYSRKGADFQMAAHIHEVNERPVPKTYAYSGGKLRLFEPLANQVTTINRASAYSSYLMLGFGASGKELAEKWEIKYDGMETLDGVSTAKLELVAKDPTVRKNLPKVTIWVDLERGVSLKQIFEQGPGAYRVCVYFNIRTNTPLPGDAFTFTTNKQTQFLNQ